MTQPGPQPPPHAPILELTFATVVARVLYAVTQRGIPDLLADGPRTPDEVAAKVGGHPTALLQVLRALAAAGIFTHGSDGRFGLTPVGETLVTGHPTAARDLVLTLGGPAFWAAMGAMPQVLETGKTGIEIALGTSFFDYLRQHADEEAVFNRTMIAVHGGEPAAVAEAYDFSGIGKVLDVVMLAVAAAGNGPPTSTENCWPRSASGSNGSCRRPLPSASSRRYPYSAAAQARPTVRTSGTNRRNRQSTRCWAITSKPAAVARRRISEAVGNATRVFEPAVDRRVKRRLPIVVRGWTIPTRACPPGERTRWNSAHACG